MEIKKYVIVAVKTEEVYDHNMGAIGTKYIYPDWQGLDHRIICNKQDLTQQIFIIKGDQEKIDEFMEQEGITELTREECDMQGKKFKEKFKIEEWDG